MSQHSEDDYTPLPKAFEGKIVSMIEHEGVLVVATESTLYGIKKGSILWTRWEIEFND